MSEPGENAEQPITEPNLNTVPVLIKKRTRIFVVLGFAIAGIFFVVVFLFMNATTSMCCCPQGGNSIEQQYRLGQVYGIKDDHVYVNTNLMCPNYKVIEGADAHTFSLINPVYAKDNKSVYLNGSILTDADPPTFHLLTQDDCGQYAERLDYLHPHLCYSADALRVYLDGKPVNGSDPQTFIISPESNVYSLDSQNAYYKGDKIYDADRESFVVISPMFAKDSQNAFAGGMIIEGADVATFHFVATTTALLFAVDANRAYQYYPLKDELLFAEYPKSGDPKTFLVMNDLYAKDSKQVYTRVTDRSSLFGQPVALQFSPGGLSGSWVVIPGADPSTFRVLENDYWFARDKNSIYNDGLSLPLDPATFSIVENTYFVKDKSKVMFITGYAREVLPSADPATFQPIGTTRQSWSDFARDNEHVYYQWQLLQGENPDTFNPHTYSAEKSARTKAKADEAQKVGTIEACKQLEVSSYCITNLAKEKKDPSLCSQQSTPDLKDWCLQLVGDVIHEANVCEMIVTRTDRKWFCYQSLAEVKGQVEYCKKAKLLGEPLNSKTSIATAYDQCVMAVVRKSKDPSSCTLVSLPWQKTCEGDAK